MPGQISAAIPVQNPVGYKMGDGYQTFFVFAFYQFPVYVAPAFSFWEREVKPAGMDGGEAVDTTTMRNNAWRTYAPRHLKTLTEMTANCAWDPVVYSNLVGNINKIGQISIYFPDPEKTTLTFYGYIVKFEPGEHKEGDMPIAVMTVRPTNTDENTVEQPPFLSVTTPGT
jgi:hypothetical protein